MSNKRNDRYEVRFSKFQAWTQCTVDAKGFSGAARNGIDIFGINGQECTIYVRNVNSGRVMAFEFKREYVLTNSERVDDE